MAAEPFILPLTARLQSWAAGRLTIFGLFTGEAQPPQGNARRGQGGPRGVREKRTPLGGLPPVGPGALPLPQRGRGSGEGEGEKPPIGSSPRRGTQNQRGPQRRSAKAPGRNATQTGPRPPQRGPGARQRPGAEEADRTDPH